MLELVLVHTRIEALSLKDIHCCILHVLVLGEVKLAVAILFRYLQAEVELVQALHLWRIR